MDRVVLIQGPPGTGRTTVITAAVTSIISFPAASSRTIWIAAQSNVAAKNIAEKFAKMGFYDFVSKEFHFDWHEHLYEKLESCLIRSETFSREGVALILCTLGMLSNNHLEPSRHVNPVDILIFDEGSQIEFTLAKIIFIGDKQAISTLHSIFEVNHLHKTAVFLDTQYRIPRVLGDFISQRVYNGKLKICHANSVSLPCRFIDVERGQEEPSGKSWINPSEAQVVVQIAAAYQAKALNFRIAENVRHEDKVFKIDSFQGNEAEHIIIFLGRANTMIICTSRAFIWGLGASTLVGQLVKVLGPQAWVNGEIVV
ncbi:P-loop containing nucleoside triphosphate hydrolase protein [Pisolithus tinctorius]|nr:P-loop containing nucleoside triphosphate hydrolase protein [Pisolithus tinctorius]